MKSLKVLLGVMVFALALAMVVSPVMAHPKPQPKPAIAVAVDLKAAKVSNFNYGLVFNDVSTWANSGGNWTWGSNSDTGNASADATVKTKLNSSSTSIGIWDSGLGPMAMNQGGHGGSIALAADLTLAGVSNFNLGSVMNFVYTGANTGHNMTMGQMECYKVKGKNRCHMVGGDSMTGNAEANAEVSTNLNSSETTIEICDFESGPMAVNLAEEDGDKCGHKKCDHKGGDPLALALDLTAVGVCNFNAGFVYNDVITWANSGWNFTLGGNSDTGKAEANAIVDTKMNSNITKVTVMESGSGAVAANLGKGGLAVALEADLVKVGNHNFGLVCNDVMTVANSGGNLTFGGKSDTGNALASAKVTNAVNSNDTSVSIGGEDGALALNMVGSSPCAPCGPVVDGCLPVACKTEGTTAANIGTGGVAIAADVDAAAVTNDNVAFVDNNVTTVANSGGNVTVGESGDSCGSCGPCNPCGGGEETTTNTGNANASSTVSNTVNTNTTEVVIGGLVP